MFHLLFYIFTAKNRKKKGRNSRQWTVLLKRFIKKDIICLLVSFKGAAGWVCNYYAFMDDTCSNTTASHQRPANISPHRSKMVLTETKKSHYRSHHWDNNFKRLMRSIKGQKCHCSRLALENISPLIPFQVSLLYSSVEIYTNAFKHDLETLY